MERALGDKQRRREGLLCSLPGIRREDVSGPQFSYLLNAIIDLTHFQVPSDLKFLSFFSNFNTCLTSHRENYPFTCWKGCGKMKPKLKWGSQASELLLFATLYFWKWVFRTVDTDTYSSLSERYFQILVCQHLHYIQRLIFYPCRPFDAQPSLGIERLQE